MAAGTAKRSANGPPPTGPLARVRVLPVRAVGGPGRLIAVLTAALLVVAVVLPPALVYLRLHPARHPLEDDPARHSLAYADVTFDSPLDGARIRGWRLQSPVPTGRAVVVVPGIDDDRLVGGITLRLAPALLAAGYDVLAIDLRAEGESESAMQTFGAGEQWDVVGAVAMARRLGADRVAVLGFSLGGASALLAAARDPSVDAVVADSAFAELRDVIVHELTVNDRLPGPAADYGLLLFRAMSGVDPATVSPVTAIAAIDRPVLLVHGDADGTVPVGDSERLLRAAGGSASRWVVPGGTHARSYFIDPAAYTARLLAFLDRSLR